MWGSEALQKSNEFSVSASSPCVTCDKTSCCSGDGFWHLSKDDGGGAPMISKPQLRVLLVLAFLGTMARFTLLACLAVPDVVHAGVILHGSCSQAESL